MSQPTVHGSLAERLRALRTQHKGVKVTQSMVAAALGISVPSISSWESGTVPPTERLYEYALLFSTDRSFDGAEPTLLDESDLTTQEERRRQALIDELVTLRDRAVRSDGQVRPDAGALGGRFWHFPDGAPVTIITTPMFRTVVEQIPYASPWHPNHIASLLDGDGDSTIELFGHIRAENPTAEVRFLTADQTSERDLTGHVIVLGQGDQMLQWRPGSHAVTPEPGVLGYLAARLELPVGTQLPEGGDPQYDSEFVVTLDEQGEPTYVEAGAKPARLSTYRPRWLRQSSGPRSPRLDHEGVPLLQYDVALLARKPNQLNLATTVTVCAGVFSRGTYGAVRALTDPQMRTRNEQFLTSHFGGTDDFWLLFYVPVFRGMSGLGTVTPDLARPFHRLRGSR